MARINFNDIDNYSPNVGTDWLRLVDDGDNTLVQFLFRDLEDLDIFSVHEEKLINKDGKEVTRSVNCLRKDYNDPLDICPLCEKGKQPKPMIILTMFDHNDNKVKIWQRGKKFIEMLKGYLVDYPDLTKVVFRLTRNGKRNDQRTTYSLVPVTNVEPIDISEIERPKLLGRFILDKNADEMRTFIETGEFPEVDNDSSQEEVVSRRSRRG